ncbi:glycoside hydrolase family 16 protein [Nocardioides sp. 616]|uniref:glycoside hydrolase family 16 protein n=1 Tax=Nocardioides sp. 616 TaxID=2268090 RepID=UPI0013B3ADA3|nr:glycoside hydrolase family 16 protein [Nocardioides sp. 616]
MSHSYRHVGALVALLLPAGLLAAVPAGNAAPPPTSSTVAASPPVTLAEASARAAVRQVRVQVLPPIAQNGRAKASADRAAAVLQVRVKPGRARTKVRIQARTPSGWKAVRTVRTKAGGVAEVQLQARRNGLPAAYRAKVGQRTSNVGDLATWGAPVFTEEFKGSRLSGSWHHRARDYSPESLRACSKGSPKAARVAKGALRLSVLRDRSRSGKCLALRKGKREGPFAYRLNGHVSTEKSFAFTYGVAAARIKFQRRAGQHASFWMQPVSGIEGGRGPRYTGAEIDVVEWFGSGKASGGITSFTYHNTPGGKRVKTGGHIRNVNRFLAGRNDSWFKRYHVFSVEWTPKEYVFRIDGQETWRSRRGISHRPQFLILSLLSSDYEIAMAGDRGLGTQHTLVDWVRVWQEQD